MSMHATERYYTDILITISENIIAMFSLISLSREDCSAVFRLY